MVKLGVSFTKYSANGPSVNVKINDSLHSNHGDTLRNYIKRKIFKATKEEVCHLLKSTSNLNIPSFPSYTKESKIKKSKQSKKVNKVLPDEVEKAIKTKQSCQSDACNETRLKSNVRQSEIAINRQKTLINVQGEQVNKIVYQSTSTSKPLEEAVAKKKKEKWSKKVKRAAIKTCKYLGYGAQMISPLGPYADIPMPSTWLDSFQPNYNPYPSHESNYSPYSGHSTYDGFSYGMSHYGFY